MAACGTEKEVIDLHSGGEDLRFPHHDNEMAQSHAKYKKEEWIRYFIHSGHLNIKGEKMSKSMKNFTTIKTALKEVGASTLRMYYAQTKYNNKMNFDPEQRYVKATDVESIFKNFFRNSGVTMRNFRSELVELSQKPRRQDLDLGNTISQAREDVDASFRDDFNTPEVLKVLMKLISKVNIYMSEEKENVRHLTIKKSVEFVHETLLSMGLDYSSKVDGNNGESLEGPLLDIIAEYRKQVRDLVRQKKFDEILELNDKVRDEQLFELGVKLEDVKGEAKWVKCGKADLLREREQKVRRDEKNRMKKEAKRKAELAKMKVCPNEIFRNDKKYEGATFGEDGIPVLSKEGKEYNKKNKKYFKKQRDKQQKLHQKYLDLQKE